MEETVTLIKLPCKPTIHTIKDKAEEVQDSKKCPFGIANSNAMKFMMILKYPVVAAHLSLVRRLWFLLRRNSRRGALHHCSLNGMTASWC